MKHAGVLLLAILSICLSEKSLAQSLVTPNDSNGINTYSLFNNGESVSPVNSVQLNMAISPMGVVPNYFTGNITVGISGVLSASYVHDNSFGTPLGKIVPTNQLAMRIQLLEQRQYYPAVSVEYQSMINKSAEFYSMSDLNSAAAPLVLYGLNSISYNAHHRRFGIGLTSHIKNKVTLSGLIGIYQLNWQQSWTYYTSDPYPGPAFGNFPLPKETTLSLFVSAAINYTVTEEISVYGATKSLPLLEIEPTTFRLGVKNGYQNSIGIQYQLWNSLRIDITDAYFAGYIHIRNYHHLRVGFRTALAL